MERRNKSGIASLIAPAICCGGPLLLIFIVSNVAFLWSLVRSGSFWAGTALLLGGIAFFLIRRRRARQVRLLAMHSPPPPHPILPTPGLKSWAIGTASAERERRSLPWSGPGKDEGKSSAAGEPAAGG